MRTREELDAPEINQRAQSLLIAIAKGMATIE